MFKGNLTEMRGGASLNYLLIYFLNLISNFLILIKCLAPPRIKSYKKVSIVNYTNIFDMSN